jgi:hypothetical protein
MHSHANARPLALLAVTLLFAAAALADDFTAAPGGHWK